MFWSVNVTWIFFISDFCYLVEMAPKRAQMRKKWLQNLLNPCHPQCMIRTQIPIFDQFFDEIHRWRLYEVAQVISTILIDPGSRNYLESHATIYKEKLSFFLNIGKNLCFFLMHHVRFVNSRFRKKFFPAANSLSLPEKHILHFEEHSSHRKWFWRRTFFTFSSFANQEFFVRSPYPEKG